MPLMPWIRSSSDVALKSSRPRSWSPNPWQFEFSMTFDSGSNVPSFRVGPSFVILRLTASRVNNSQVGSSYPIHLKIDFQAQLRFNLPYPQSHLNRIVARVVVQIFELLTTEVQGCVALGNERDEIERGRRDGVQHESEKRLGVLVRADPCATPAYPHARQRPACVQDLTRTAIRMRAGNWPRVLCLIRRAGKHCGCIPHAEMHVRAMCAGIQVVRRLDRVKGVAESGCDANVHGGCNNVEAGTGLGRGGMEEV
ncbi:hypothetical protein C8F04DRAFT_1236982 [Mycena alexandri]|uniref:Uncharacterized protein n=1 Tax=Mycena alexandri TaxID=1745969 RepID=A0AAD6SN89_9AGAR|nr:hypothetical protein C8F04DRAFT_1236982 [Mycena alexandri]